ncbi:hypothetical protein DXV75_02145 [Alteromonas aestuariivivens]|uniref:Ancillary SecYEG translocon subunit n=1 Tax=Alteromonas aestuariivivens TaxID=1938339 RepID=A0A3D8MEH8_9ALTE|nr:tetratricopeptide repeat protein [Alteromonas aestuariivivens]RDV29279.1 hypothetical protein DXV75_02145 [Alteromonas aestuariivivens]
MEQFATEEQQVEAIKRFWKDHGTAIIVGAVVGLGGLWGWRAYSESQMAAQEAASAAYQQAVESIEQEGSDKLTAFIANNNDNGYGHIAGLVAAQQAVTNGDLEGASAHLKSVVESSEDPHIVALASIRLARVQVEQGSLEDALATIEGVSDSAFDAQLSELKGDIYSRQGKVDDARMAYSSALESAANNPLLQMKLDNLSVTSGS